MKDKPVGYVTFISHAGRDLMNRLAPTVRGIESKQVQYQQHLDDLKEDWKNEWGGEEFKEFDDVENGHLIPYGVCQKIKKLIKEHQDGRKRSENINELFFNTFLDSFSQKKIKEDFPSNWKETREWFLKHTHLRQTKFSEEVPYEVATHFQRLNEFLYLAASSEYERIKVLHEILEETNG